MLKTYEAVLEPDGHLHFLETVPALDRVAQRGSGHLYPSHGTARYGALWRDPE